MFKEFNKLGLSQSLAKDLFIQETQNLFGQDEIPESKSQNTPSLEELKTRRTCLSPESESQNIPDLRMMDCRRYPKVAARQRSFKAGRRDLLHRHLRRRRPGPRKPPTPPPQGGGSDHKNILKTVFKILKVIYLFRNPR